MLEKVEEFIHEHGLLSGDGPLIVGVSGGVDSMALLHYLCRLGAHIVCAHFDHQLRPSGERERDLVQTAARKLGAPFTSGSADVRAFQNEHRMNLEEAARLLRYRFLFKAASDANGRAVAAAHTADDQVETVLMNLMRGAGLKGLSGMAPKTILPEFDGDIPLVRPFLHTWRHEISAYQNALGFAIAQDETNQDLSFFRNRVRHEILPLLSDYRADIKRILLRSTSALGVDEAYLSEQGQKAWTQVVRDRSESWVELDAAALCAQADAVLVRILRRGIEILKSGGGRMDFSAAGRAIALVRSSKSTGSCDLLGGIQLIREYDRFWMVGDPSGLPSGDWPQLPVEALKIARIPVRIHLPEGWNFEIKAVGDTEMKPDKFAAVLDGQTLGFPLVLRSRRPGERIKPTGLAGHAKRLTDVMIDQKIPERVRARWPILVSDGEVVWVPGYRVGDAFAAGPETTGPVRARLFRD